MPRIESILELETTSRTYTKEGNEIKQGKISNILRADEKGFWVYYGYGEPTRFVRMDHVISWVSEWKEVEE
jgi:hypothetical protein